MTRHALIAASALALIAISCSPPAKTAPEPLRMLVAPEFVTQVGSCRIWRFKAYTSSLGDRGYIYVAQGKDESASSMACSMVVP